MTTEPFNWDQLQRIQSRIPLGTDSTTKEVLLQRVVGSRRMKSSVWRELVAVSGQFEFFVMLNEKIETTRDDRLLEKFLLVLAGDPDNDDRGSVPYVNNEEDKEWIHEQISLVQKQLVGRGSGNPKQNLPKSETPKAGFGATTAPLPGPTLPPDNDPLRTSVAVTLEGNIDLCKLLSETLFGPINKGSIDQIVERLLVSQPGSRIEFPLEQLGVVVKGWRNRRLSLDSSKFKRPLDTLKDLLKIASFPATDRDKLTGAMLDILAESPKGTASVQFDTRKRKAVEELLRETWVRVSNVPCNDFELPDLIVGDPQNDLNLSVFMRKLKVLPEPTPKPDDKSYTEWYAEKICQSLGHVSFQPDQWQNWLDYRLETYKDDSTFVAIFISRESQIAIRELKRNFKRLLLLEVAENDAERYYKVFTQLDDIEDALANILKN